MAALPFMMRQQRKNDLCKKYFSRHWFGKMNEVSKERRKNMTYFNIRVINLRDSFQTI
jgi:hypothetical protein